MSYRVLQEVHGRNGWMDAVVGFAHDTRIDLSVPQKRDRCTFLVGYNEKQSVPSCCMRLVQLMSHTRHRRSMAFPLIVILELKRSEP